ncbi:hypothetical protein [Rhizobium sp. OAE497]|uniref:hypothetical protein n=1 Tax=Rhizobium sp. OAE497 TaxID=2663796 RepID=UPI0018F382CE
MSTGEFRPELCGLWPERPAYGGGLLLETKSEGLPGDELRVLLNQMTAEMREQFAAFVELRKGAEIAALSGDEAAEKLARADLKAAADAMGLIVRTLEKIDQLQRQLARDREMEIESCEQAEGYAAAKGQLLAIIEQRAEEKAALIVEQRIRAWQAEAGGRGGISFTGTNDAAAIGAPEAAGRGGEGALGDGAGAVGGGNAAAGAGGDRCGPGG